MFGNYWIHGPDRFPEEARPSLGEIVVGGIRWELMAPWPLGVTHSHSAMASLHKEVTRAVAVWLLAYLIVADATSLESLAAPPLMF